MTSTRALNQPDMVARNDARHRSRRYKPAFVRVGGPSFVLPMHSGASGRDATAGVRIVNRSAKAVAVCSSVHHHTQRESEGRALQGPKVVLRCTRVAIATHRPTVQSIKCNIQPACMTAATTTTTRRRTDSDVAAV